MNQHRTGHLESCQLLQNPPGPCDCGVQFAKDKERFDKRFAENQAQPSAGLTEAFGKVAIAIRDNTEGHDGLVTISAELDRLRAEVAAHRNQSERRLQMNHKLRAELVKQQPDVDRLRAEVAELREVLDRTCTRFERAMRHSGSAEWAIIEATKQERAILAKTQLKG